VAGFSRPGLAANASGNAINRIVSARRIGERVLVRGARQSSSSTWSVKGLDRTQLWLGTLRVMLCSRQGAREAPGAPMNAKSLRPYQDAAGPKAVRKPRRNFVCFADPGQAADAADWR
jgi:hypothetical protein